MNATEVMPYVLGLVVCLCGVILGLLHWIDDLTERNRLLVRANRRLRDARDERLRQSNAVGRYLTQDPGGPR